MISCGVTDDVESVNFYGYTFIDINWYKKNKVDLRTHVNTNKDIMSAELFGVLLFITCNEFL
jgi:hypothetical protein